MRTLRDLLCDPEGRDLLRAGGIHVDPGTFRAALVSPATRLAGIPPVPLPVYVHQQPGPDPRRSVVAKLAALEALRRDAPDRVGAVFVRIDTDRAASGKAAGRISWHGADGRRRVLKVTPPGSERREFRYIVVEPQRLAPIAATLEAYVRQMPDGRAAALARLGRLRPLLVPAGAVPLARYAATLSGFLLDAHLGVRPQAVTVSDLADGGALAPALALLMAARDGFVAAFNAGVAALHGEGIGSAVGPLPDDYLPLFYSCPVDGTRLRLRRRRLGGEFHAVAEGRAGRRYLFPLGARGTSLDALFAAGRWSPDVTLPVLLNDGFSGMVAGRSSALYCLVLVTAMRAALGMRPVPILAPAALAADAPGPDGLLQAWLTG